MPCARSRPGIRPSGGFVAYLAVDHQMTPPLLGPLTGPSALPRTSASARLSGTPAAALRPKASRSSFLPCHTLQFFETPQVIQGLAEGKGLVGADFLAHMEVLGGACGKLGPVRDEQ